jgi:predicted nucleic acid-binding protein
MDDAQATGNLVFDALIVATCLEHGANEILSEDIDLRRFTSVRLRRLGEDE